MFAVQLFLLASLALTALALPTGAPLAACGDFIPRSSHGGNEQVGATPYQVNLDGFPTDETTGDIYYEPGNTYTGNGFATS